MGYYSNYLEKNKVNFNTSENREELMYKLKAEKEQSLLSESKEERSWAQTYANSSQYTHHYLGIFFYPQQSLHLDKSKMLEQEQQRIASLTTTEYFSELIDNEDETIRQNLMDSYEKMGQSIEKTKLYKIGGGVVSKVASLFGKTDELLEKYSSQFKEANENIPKLLKAEQEWQEMSNADKVDVLLTRWELEKTTDLNIEDIKTFTEQQNPEEIATQTEE